MSFQEFYELTVNIINSDLFDFDKIDRIKNISLNINERKEIIKEQRSIPFNIPSE